MKTIETLFHPEPPQWGLRGDPFLWLEMAETFRGVPLPDSSRQLAGEIEHRFEALTGQSINSSESLWLKRHSHGGMSSGGISLEFWRETAIPLLLSRFAANA
ncbi:MAG: hypothetical protein WBE58_16480 [Verrucomicrobiales bacterium]